MSGKDTFPEAEFCAWDLTNGDASKEAAARWVWRYGSARLDRALALIRESERVRKEVNGVCQWCAHAPYIVAGETRGHAPGCKAAALLKESDE